MIDQDAMFNIDNINRLQGEMKDIAIGRFIHNESQHQVSCRLGINIKRLSTIEKLAIMKLRKFNDEKFSNIE